MEQNTINNLFDIAMTAYHAENYQECINYANRIIEEAPKDEINKYRRASAWLYKGLSAIKSSIPLVSNNINEAIVCVKNAILEYKITNCEEAPSDEWLKNFEVDEYNSFVKDSANDLGRELFDYSSSLNSELSTASLNQFSNPKVFNSYYKNMSEIIYGLEYVIDLLEGAGVCSDKLFSSFNL